MNNHHPTANGNGFGLTNGTHFADDFSESIKDVGIIGIELYFPKSYVNQEDLEKFDNVTANKYVLGLGQQEMCFCHENEDVCSLSLTVTAALMDNYKVNPKDIGFLAVGTETLVDKSKSVKSVLMDLFADSGNMDLEGADEKNACFGGTQALFHAVDWMYANYATEKRLAIVVCADVAVYSAGPARCTGGAGAVAFLIGPNAPIALERGLRACHSQNVYDFYKPIGGVSTQFPRVDGPNSVETYLNAVDMCYGRFCEKWNKKFCTGPPCSLSDFVAVIFHSPYARLTQKAFSWLSFVDFKRGMMGDGVTADGDDLSDWDQLSAYKSKSLHEIFAVERTKSRSDGDRFTDKILRMSSRTADAKLNPFLEFSRRIGNMYTPSVYAQLINVFLNTELSEKSNGKRILLFSYGSGCIAAMYSLRFNLCTEKLLTAYGAIKQSAKKAHARLDQRIRHSPKQFSAALERTEQIVAGGETYIETPDDGKRSDGIPMFAGTFYLREIDSKQRRFYGQIDDANE
ncbi:hypothetical protein niasHT_007597 [Heterodera trifolii]|uniref:Hydroxymethylglutaryl-CoA synthase n=1 Tax=Heterodera trifolii TaxID=157864 RepID=A0ABD2LPX6_9BILA